MNHSFKRNFRGFTIVELSIAIMIGMATGGMVLTLFNQQLAFLRLFKDQNFLTEEAPIINNYVSRLISKADGFRLHATMADALGGTSPLMGNNPALETPRVLVLNFRQPDGSIRASILQFVPEVGNRGLYYYLVGADGTVAGPQWVVARTPTDVVFRMNNGVLQMVLTGPKAEQITYSGTTQ